VSVKPFGLYIHWPFCESKCPYCDFNSHVREKVDHARWSRALLSELEYLAQKTPNRHLTSIFFGGGTPSLMDPQTVAALITQAKHLWSHDDDLEVTLEANPSSSEFSKFQAFKQAGINRLSLGIQSLDDDVLKFLGRRHSAEMALGALQMAQKTFDRYSFDLIYGRPHQTWESWRGELERALSFGACHMSLYQLTIEKGTAFYTQHQRGDWTLPTDEILIDLYERTCDLMATQGFETYETSNYAKPGQESRHNLIYWRYQEFGGIGPGAHGRLHTPDGILETKCYKAPETWLDSVEKNGHGYEVMTPLAPKDQVQEFFLMGLRLSEGASWTLLQQTLGYAKEDLFDLKALTFLETQGYIELSQDSLKVSKDYKVHQNSVISKVIECLQI